MSGLRHALHERAKARRRSALAVLLHLRDHIGRRAVRSSAAGSRLRTSRCRRRFNSDPERRRWPAWWPAARAHGSWQAADKFQTRRAYIWKTSSRSWPRFPSGYARCHRFSRCNARCHRFSRGDACRQRFARSHARGCTVRFASGDTGRSSIRFARRDSGDHASTASSCGLCAAAASDRARTAVCRSPVGSSSADRCGCTHTRTSSGGRSGTRDGPGRFAKSTS